MQSQNTLYTNIENLTATKCRKKILASTTQGEIKQIEIGAFKTESVASGFGGRINALKSVGDQEFVASAGQNGVFYGRFGGNGFEGIRIQHNRVVFDVDVAGSFIAGGSENGEICNIFYSSL